MRKRDAVLLAFGSLWLVPAAHSQERGPAADTAPDPAQPDIEFLEYLGSWQADDDEWWVIAEWDKDNEADRRKGADSSDDDAADDGKGDQRDGGDKEEDRGEPEPPQPRK